MYGLYRIKLLAYGEGADLQMHKGSGTKVCQVNQGG